MCSYWIINRAQRSRSGRHRIVFPTVLEDPDVIVEGQAEWLKILVRNVFNNAFKYCTAHGSVTICLESTGSQVILSVLNQCQPLGDDQLARLTDRFYTLPGQDGRGVGLGLSIVKRIAELHGATLHLGSGSDEFGFSAQVRFPVEVHS